MAINFPTSPSTNDTHTHNGVTYEWDGTSWLAQGSTSTYSLPTASSTVLGGIKVGNRLTITSGVLDADVQGGVTSDSAENTVAGTLAGGSFTVGNASNNTLYGWDAGGDITTGDDNTCVGYGAGDKITDGSKNTAIGSDSLDACSSGYNNVAVGWEAGRSITTGNNNCCLGSYSGVTLGGAYNAYDPHTMVDFKLKTLYLGRPLQYDYELKDYEDEYEAAPKDIAKLISNQNIVAIVQGRSEIGPRALGNRSMLFDPRVKDGKDIVNRVKKREYFRPFAGTVLLEYARDWFDMDRLEESPFMMYAVDVLPEKRDLIPSIVHVDGTCRIQTVTREQNKHYYDLISEFYKLTGVPILFNTSFNLAGDTMVDTIEDGLYTLRNSEIRYMYLPEKETLISSKNVL